MTKAYLYEVIVESANTRTSSAVFTKEQTKKTKAVKRGIKKALETNGLAEEFAFAERKVSNMARCFQVYASPKAAKVLEKEVPGIKKVEQMTVSAYSLTINL